MRTRFHSNSHYYFVESHSSIKSCFFFKIPIDVIFKDFYGILPWCTSIALIRYTIPTN